MLFFFLTSFVFPDKKFQRVEFYTVRKCFAKLNLDVHLLNKKKTKKSCGFHHRGLTLTDTQTKALIDIVSNKDNYRAGECGTTWIDSGFIFYGDKNEIVGSLVDNFHWVLISRRKQLNITRKQLAQSISVPEEDIKALENGILPHSDYVLISKLENYFKINLRKTGISQNGSSEFSARKGSVHRPKWMDNLEKSAPGTKADELVSNVEIDDFSDQS